MATIQMKDDLGKYFKMGARDEEKFEEVARKTLQMPFLERVQSIYFIRQLFEHVPEYVPPIQRQFWNAKQGKQMVVCYRSNIKDILTHVLNKYKVFTPRLPGTDGEMKDCIDGDCMKTHKFLKRQPGMFKYRLYVDGADTTNSIGISRSFDMLYIQVMDLPTHLQGRLSTIYFLGVIQKEKDNKNLTLDVWKDIVREMRDLETIGTTLTLNNEEEHIKACCLMMCGDNKSQYELGGMPGNFKVDEKQDKKICRFCKAQSKEIYACPTTIGPPRHFAHVNRADNVPDIHVFNSLCAYEESTHPPYFLVLDFLHDILEGVAPIGFGHILHEMTTTPKYWINFAEINTRIANMPKTRTDKRDPVKPLSNTCFGANNRLNLAKGSCYITFMRMFPLVFYNAIPDKEKQPLFWLASSLIDVMRLLLRPTQTEASINRLEHAIEIYFHWHVEEKVKTLIKHHNLLHYPGIIYYQLFRCCINYPPYGPTTLIPCSL